MSRFQLTATWAFASPFHIGTGLSGSGADRTVRAHRRYRDGRDPDDRTPEGGIVIPEISGDAFKGAVRGSAERMVRWLVHPRGLEEGTDDSWPRHPALRRIFAWQALGTPGEAPPAAYRFSTPSYLGGGTAGSVASTAIHPERGVAAEKTLRVMEQWSADAYFGLTIDGRGGRWQEADSRDYLDLTLLVAALVAASQAGGKKGNGMGWTQVHGLAMQPPVKLPELNAAALARLRDSLLEEVRRG